MRKKLLHTKCTVKLRPSADGEQWHLLIESYPVQRGGSSKPDRVFEFVNRKITTPLWEMRTDKCGRTRRKPKRDPNGVIMCASAADRESCIYADKVRMIRQQEYDTAAIYSENDRQALLEKERSGQDFLEYFRGVIHKCHPNGSQSVVVNWSRVYRLLVGYSRGRQIPFNAISVGMLEDIKFYLLNSPRGGGKPGRLSESTAATYFAIVKAGVHRAFIDEYISVDVASKVKGISTRKAKRETLTQEEMERLAVTPCQSPIVKRAFFFAILTGMRLCDIQCLRWGDITKGENGWRIDFAQKKTKVVDYLPISAQAYMLCGARGNPDSPVFDGLQGSAWISRPLKKWMTDAGITKHVTFHCSRHTFATLQLQSDTDIYTIMGMLGHTSVKTTQIYAHIVDTSKRKAADSIHINNLETIDLNQ